MVASTSKKNESAIAKAVRLARTRPGITGVDYGFVYENGVRQKTTGIRFHVAEKFPLSKLPAEQVLPTALDDMRCDVVEAKYSLHGSPRSQCDPLQLGVSVGNAQRSTTGTMGPCVRDRHSGKQGFISNWHVLCGSPNARAGEAISQPGPMHQGTQAARIAGILERWAPLDAGCDAAVALLVEGVAENQSMFDSSMAIAGTEVPRLGTHLIKFGVTSLLTHGFVDGVDGSFRIDYSSYGDTTRWIDGLRIVVDPDHPDADISLAGDSGSAWVDAETREIVALHFAGEDGLGPTAEYALAQPIQRVLNILDVDPL
jgi:hypothetical protein